MKNIKEIKNKLLSKEQAEAVKSMIIASMRGSYTSIGTIPGDDFMRAASAIANKVIDDTQKALLQSNVYEEVVNSIKPLKVSKKKKNARK